MAEEGQQNETFENIKRSRKWVWCAALVVVIAAIICCLLWKASLWKSQTVDEELTAIEAARAIPDEENAAIIYSQLLEDYDENSPSLDITDINLDNLTRREPWLSKDYPQIAEWLQQHENTIATLMEASKKEKCRFPIIIDLQQMPLRMDRFRVMRRWAYLLIRATNNDIAEGRIKAAVQKYRCLIQMGNHLYQQPNVIDLLVSISTESLALRGMACFIVEGNATEPNLNTIEAIPVQTKNNWTEISSKINECIEVERLFRKKNVGFFDRLKFAWMDMAGDAFESIRVIYYRLLADRRGNRILIALRRYKNKNDRWAENCQSLPNNGSITNH